MTKTTVYYYTSSSGENVIRKFILTLQKHQQAKVRHLFLLIEKYGLSSAIPHIKKITHTLLWEIRILGNDNIRFIYITKTQNSIYVLHGFVKKTQKTSHKDLTIALKRLEELKIDL